MSIQCQNFWLSAKRAWSVKLQDARECRFRQAGHILHFPSHQHSNIALQWSPVGGTRWRSRLKKLRRRTFQEHLRWVHILWDEAKTLVTERLSWQKESCCRMCFNAGKELSQPTVVQP